MSDQHPGGVAQRVIAKLESDYWHAEQHGAEIMHDELYAELIRIRDNEVEHPTENSILIGDKLYVRWSYVSDRLGLDLNEQESDA